MYVEDNIMFMRKEAKSKDNTISQLLRIIQSISTSKSVIDNLHEHLFFKERLRETALLIRSLVFKKANNGDKIYVSYFPLTSTLIL